MRLICMIYFMFLYSKGFFAFPKRGHGYHHYHHHHHQLGSHVLEKLRSISHWLDSLPSTTAFDYIYRINIGAGLNLFQGDIDGFNPNLRTATTDRKKIWNTRTIPFVMDPVFETTEQRDINAAIDDFKHKTCVRFVPRTNEKDYIRFTKIDGCYSKIGRVGGEQNVSLVSACLIKGTVIHELMHVLGFFHEQSRPDRDGWVQIVTENIIPGTERNFDKLDKRLVDTLGVQYDYGSVLHYSQYAFSRNNNPTILPTRMHLAMLGQRDGFSYLDLERINLLYRCDIPGPLDSSLTSAAPTSPSRATPTTVHPTPYPNPTTINPNTVSTSSMVSTHGQTSTPSNTPKSTVPSLTTSAWSHWSVWSFCNLQCVRTRYRFCFSNDHRLCPGSTEESRTCTTACQDAWTLGCWKNNGTNSAIPSVEGQYATLVGSYSTRDGAVRKCADVATDNGHIVFAVFDNGMCLTGPNAHKNFHKYGASTDCSYKGDGSNTAMNVYTFQQDMDGAWGQWTDWTQCTQICGGGKRYRYRYCNSPPPVGHGATCPGKDHEIQECNTQLCPVDTKCGVKYHTGLPGTSGVINVGEYDNFMKCEYKIMTGDPSLTISVSITRIDLEFSLSCVSDALMIYDGPNDNSTFLGAHCGRIPPASILSSSNKIFLKFLTDETTTGTGFTVLYTINQNLRKSCVQPKRPAHGSVIGTSNFVGDSLFFQCHENFALIGSRSVTCVDQPSFALWSDTFPICTRQANRDSVHQRAILCSFEGNLCGFKQHITDDFNWIVAHPEGSRFPQRPMADHTYGRIGAGSSLIAEATRVSHLGDKATIQTPSITPHTGKQCLAFWVRTYGSDSSYLEVSLQSMDISKNLFMIPVDEMDKDQKWMEYSVTFSSREVYQIVFQFNIGEGFGSSVALDDVLIAPGECELR